MLSEKLHKYIILDDKLKTGVISEMSYCIINYFFENYQSRNNWKKDKKLYTVGWKDKKNKSKKSIPLNYRMISEHIRENTFFNPDFFNLPELECYWLDNSVNISIDFHKFDSDKGSAAFIEDGTPKRQFGIDYPIVPRIDREGHIFSTFQPQLMSRIIKSRNELIENSNKALQQNWILDLRSLINDTISLLEITLNQIYIKAQYSPLQNWIFNKEKLGEKHGRRLNDKLKWVRQISGNNLDIEMEIDSLNSLRELRNHFNHFDPPSLVVTLEEATKWLNQIIDVGVILYKIRKTMNIKISTQLINLLLQRIALFNPEPSFRKRIPLTSKINGYHSSTWRTE